MKRLICIVFIFCACCGYISEQSALDRITKTFPNAEIKVFTDDSTKYIIKDGNNYFYAERCMFFNFNIFTTYSIKNNKGEVK